MKLVNVRFEYSCGMIMRDRATVDPSTGEVFLPPRVTRLIDLLSSTEVLKDASVLENDRLVRLEVQEKGTFKVNMSDLRAAMFARGFRAIAHPTELQRQENGRIAHLLSIAAFAGAAANVLRPRAWTADLLFETVAFILVGVLLAAVGFICSRA